MDASLYAVLQDLRATARALVLGVAPDERRRTHHPDLSPLLWHFGHMLYIERLWIGERIGGEPGDEREARLYRPDGMPKPLRGAALPGSDVLEQEWRTWDGRCAELIVTAQRQRPADALLRLDFIVHFLIEHHSQHIETMHQILCARALNLCPPDFAVARSPASAPLNAAYALWPGGCTAIGADDEGFCYDNERPRHLLSLPAFAIATTPVTNAQYLGFMEAGGYREPRYWSHEAWHWKDQNKVEAPWHWRQDPAGHWYGVDTDGPIMLEDQAAVQGLSAYEAHALARYAGARLPHEGEWETAAHAGLVGDIGAVWEWCANRFYPYPGFRPFPYRGYSMPWFDGAHTSLRGASAKTPAPVRRHTFRNFHSAHKRHIFAGVRLCRQNP